MKSLFLFQNEFKEWLISTSDLTEGTANSYLSYLRGVNRLFLFSKKNTSGEFDLFNILNTKYEEDDINSINNTLIYVAEVLSRKDSDKVFNKSSKTLQNYRSGIYSYLNFLIEYFGYIVDDEGSTEVSEKDLFIKHILLGNRKELLPNDNIIIEHSKNDLRKVFKPRIKTQDRYYDEIFYPIRFINRIFRKHNKEDDFNNWIDEVIDSIRILFKDQEIAFSELSSLTIKGEKVFIITKTNKGREKIAYTKLANNIDREAFKVSGINEISLDHTLSLKDLMTSSLINKLPTFLLITKELKSHIDGKVSNKKLRNLGTPESLESFIQTINTKELLNELRLISSKTEIQLMYRSYNSSKG